MCFILPTHDEQALSQKSSSQKNCWIPDFILRQICQLNDIKNIKTRNFKGHCLVLKGSNPVKMLWQRNLRSEDSYEFSFDVCVRLHFTAT